MSPDFNPQMRRLRQSILALGVAIAAAAGAAPARADGQVNVYCGVQEEWCRAMVTAFEKETGIKANMTRKSAGETYAQVKAEATNPRGDIWWGGTGDPHLQAAEEGLTAAYKSPLLGEQHDWSTRVLAITNGRSVGIYSGALGFGYSAKTLAAKKLAPPKCWADLIKPEYKDEVQVADPNSSGTSYTLLATVVQLMGEDKAYDYMKALHKNVNQYTKSGAAPAKAVSLGETAIGITFMHDMTTVALTNPDVIVVAPCEGTGYEIGSMSIIQGAKNMKEAQAWYDFALTVKAQLTGAETKSLQLPSNKGAPLPKGSPDLKDIKLITYDFVKYGLSAERSRLLAKWDKEVKSQPK